MQAPPVSHRARPKWCACAPNGKIGHAEIRLGEGAVMLADESPEMSHKAPQSEDLDRAEMDRRMEAMTTGGQQP